MNTSTKYALYILIGLVVLGFTGFLGYKIYSESKLEKFRVHTEQTQVLKDLIVNKKDYISGLAMAEVQITQNDSNIDAWLWKGVSEFQLRKYPEAKVSFQKALSLDPQSLPAKNYLELLGSNSNVVISQESDSISRVSFESRLGVAFDPKVLTFLQAAPLPAEEGMEFISGSYYSTRSFNEINTYVKNLVFPQGLTASAQYAQSTSTVVYEKKNTAKNTTYFVSINKKSDDRVMVIISFSKTK